MSTVINSSIKNKKLIEPIQFEQLVDTTIHKPGQYMGNELGSKQHNWEAATVHWALSFPELYEVGASNLGHIILYSIINKIPGQLCDRAYLPESDLAKRLRKKSIALFGVDTRYELKNFDLLGFSLSYELGATNILEMLDLAQINIYAKKRQDMQLNDPNSIPLIFAGGPTATSNPEPYADFFDFFALGDGEELLPEIGLIMYQAKKLNLTRSQALLTLAEVPGVYVPSLYQSSKDFLSIKPSHPSAPKRVMRRVARPIPHYSMGLVPNVETVHDRLTIEIRRGCTRGCRFCQPGMLTRPARDVDPNEVIKAVETGMEKTGYSDFSLLSLSCSDYLSLPEVGVKLKNKLNGKNISLQLPSQRIDRFDDNIAHIVGGARRPGLTFAPEAGSQRLRDIINKGLTNEDLLSGIRKAMENQYHKVKLYFMIGLPGERDEDILAIARTCRWLQVESRDLGKLNLNITISNFTPKPHTPFQWHSVSTDEFSRRQNLLKDTFHNLKVRNIKVNYTDVRISAIEDFLGRGDRRLAAVIESAWKSGAGMDAWFESQERAYKAWTHAISKAGLSKQLRELEMGNWRSALALNKQELSDFCAKPLPWDHIDTGIEKKWLIKDLQNALNVQTVPDCSFHSCSSCGVCGAELGHNQVIAAQPIPIREETIPPQIERQCRIRVKFSKTKPMHLISHLDLIRLLERSLRRSHLPVSYSGGFHPLPRLEIALALPLGIEGLGEWMDIDFYKEVNPVKMREKLQETLPKGIQLQEVNSIPISKTSLSQQLLQANWRFNLKSNAKHNPNFNDWYSGIKKIKNSTKLIWKDKDKKGRFRERDMVSQLKDLELIFSKELNLEGNVSILLNSLISSNGQSVKPIHIKHWLSKYLGENLELENIQRSELILKSAKI